MAWFHRPKYTIIRKATEQKEGGKIPEGLWSKCDKCGGITLTKEIADNLEVCPKCGQHNRITAQKRVEITTDEGTFTKLFEEVRPVDFLNFPEYSDKLGKAVKKTGLTEAVITGKGKINGREAVLAVTDFFFMGGSLGSVMGERMSSAVEMAIDEKLPFVSISASGGGARMHEGIMSLMQMAKISASLAKLSDAKLPYISVLTDPTGGGVTASFAMLGDLNIAEPGALIMFAGPRVIEQTIRQKLPPGFQRSEFLQEHGMVDMIVDRREMKKALSDVLNDMLDENRYQAAK